MTHIFSDYAYGPGPRDGCWWDETCSMPRFPKLQGECRFDVVLIGGGFTGLSAALHLAQSGVCVAVLEAQSVGWGASGRNGGFCCLGGAKISDTALDRRFGKGERIAYRRAERAAVELVDRLVRTHSIDVDRHSHGQVELAHRARDVAALEASVASFEENFGIAADVLDRETLDRAGLGGPFHGGLNIPLGFGLNPRKYLAGLVAAATGAGAQVFEQSAVQSMERSARGWELNLSSGTVRADQVIVATNGYSSETVPGWLAGRYMPGQSNVLVTRPLTDTELDAAGWTSDQMAYDTRNLLHYFRLMPDRRFLFGMRGGLLSGPGAERRARHRLRRDFDAMFPAWAQVSAAHSWSGMVCLARDLLPFIGAVPDHKGLWAGMCYHGNGVAMGTMSGAILADLVQGREPDIYPEAVRQPLARFPLGRARRAIMPGVYAGLMLADL